MKCTAEDLLHLMSYVLDTLNPADRTYLINAMRHVGPIQRWGMYAAGPAQQPGVKNGWSIEPDGGPVHIGPERTDRRAYGCASPSSRILSRAGQRRTGEWQA